MFGDTVVTENCCPPEVPPPGAGLKTVTDRLPVVDMSEAAIEALNSVELMKVVTRLLPFQRTMEPFTNPVPKTVKSNAGPPTEVLEGVSPVTVGVGFVLVMLKTRLADVPPPGAGVRTLTLTLPEAETSAELICARSSPLEINVVARFDPLQRTMELGTKPDPFTVKLKAALPADVVDGASELATGAGLLAGAEIVNV